MKNFSGLTRMSGTDRHRVRMVKPVAIVIAALTAGSIWAGVTYATGPASPPSTLTVGACGGAHPAAWFNDQSNWGTAPGKIGPGVNVELCGTVTTPLTFRGSGVRGKPITLTFQPGAQLSAAVCPGTVGCLDMSYANYITVDGGIDGVVQNTADGTGLANSTDQSLGVYMAFCNHCTIRNLTIANIYVRTSATDYAGGGNGVELYDGNYDTLDHVTIHDSDWAVYMRYDGSGRGQDVTIRDSDFSRSDHDIALTFNFAGGTTGPFFMYGNHLHDFANWDSPDDNYHHDGLHCYTSTTNGAPAHIDGLYWYDNLTDGTMGNNMTSPVFIEGDAGGTPCADPTSKLYFFNNVSIADTAVNNGLLTLDSGQDFAYNNTFVGNSTDGGVGAVVYQTNNVTFQNNVMSTFNQLADTTSSTFAPDSPDYNVYANGGGNAFVCNGDYLSFLQFAGWKACTGGAADAHSKRANNAMLNADGSPQPKSPVKNAGTNLTTLCVGDLAPLCTDYIGNSRSTTDPWDAGAFNWVLPHSRSRSGRAD